MSNFETINGCLDDIDTSTYEQALHALSNSSNGDTIDVAYCNLGQRSIRMTKRSNDVDIDIKSFGGHTVIHSPFDYRNGDYGKKAEELKNCIDETLKCSKTNVPSVCLI